MENLSLQWRKMEEWGSKEEEWIVSTAQNQLPEVQKWCSKLQPPREEHPQLQNALNRSRVPGQQRSRPATLLSRAQARRSRRRSRPAPSWSRPGARLAQKVALGALLVAPGREACAESGAQPLSSRAPRRELPSLLHQILLLYLFLAPILVNALKEIASTMGATYWEFDSDYCSVKMLRSTPDPPKESERRIVK
ncbi:hypothetical protein VIGAN_01258600 [Vigna angularis var. angularis]|uniref:Uncharacterized protein n=1 Tax=Vigna angularis var. angularis TaxID=157739 RepID=A0A0S3R2J5_PHAAN|nr:hypothetical protein VIGAN_01258600 [Vigna angularis var. angularis]